jgi:ribose 5-phosphate isomerase A
MNQKEFQNKAKQAAAEKALTFIQNGMRIGLGTGSTSEFFIHSLAAACKQGLKISAFSSSISSQKLAESLGIPLMEESQATYLDLTIDGADEVGPDKTLIKGGGGALLREKILAAMAGEMIVIVDAKKIVKEWGGFPLPVEIARFACQATMRHFADQGFHAKLREKASIPFVTDNGNWIVDLALDNSMRNPQQLDSQLKSIPGVLETGLFIGLAGRIIVGNEDGTTTIID